MTTDKPWLMLGDCLERMNEIPDASVDMILCDLPYGTTACKWDVVIPLEPLWQRYWHVLKSHGAVVLFGTEPFSSSLRMSQIEKYKYDWIWLKESRRYSGFQHAKNRPLLANENISVFSKGKVGHESQLRENRMRYFPQDLTPIKTTVRAVEPSKHESILGERKNQIGRKYNVEFVDFPCTTLMFDSDYHGFHPTQKPVSLLKYLIQTYTLEDETVLDNCMGSGSTGVACVNTNRKFIGIEKDEKYFQIAEDRIAQAQAEKDSLLFAC